MSNQKLATSLPNKLAGTIPLNKIPLILLIAAIIAVVLGLLTAFIIKSFL